MVESVDNRPSPTPPPPDGVTQPQLELPRPYVVGIGASAGGLEALERFFDNVPNTSGMAFVVVQHLSPDFKSLMDELLARHTDLPIALVSDGMPIEPDHVYLIPAKKEMIIAEGRLLLSERDRSQELSLPIDVFFRSLAQDQGDRAVAIVLSGTGSDGSRGAKDVWEAGGLVLVQDVASAQFDGMPRATREAGVAHWVGRPEEMPRVLLEYAQRPGMQRELKPDGSGLKGIEAVYRMLEDQFGLDFTHYKPSTVTRRIERRLQLTRASDIEAYVEWLKREREELDALYRDLLIGVTRFFRDEEAFAVLREKVLPELFRSGPRDVPLRAWVAGCATGEEAYSIAILLHELSQELEMRPFKIFASDVHRGSLEIATAGVYDEEAVAGVSRERLERYFLRRGRNYQVVPDIRQMVVFAPHNVIKDPPFTRVDLVTCRNLLIYLQPPAQQKVLSLFHFALNRSGILFLGPSETPGHLAQDFEAIDAPWRIFRKQRDIRIAIDAGFPRGRSNDGAFQPSPAVAVRDSFAQLLGTYDSLLDEFMPPSLLVNEHGELVHSFSGASRFLKMRDGRQGLDVLEIVDTELKMVLVGGMKRALTDSTPLVFRGVRVGDQAENVYQVTLRPVRSRTGNARHLLISFDGMGEAAEKTANFESSQTEIDLNHVSRNQLAALEAELVDTKQNLQAAIEQLETNNEELQATNEELVASNEELQSTNEELQSVNEELYTVNAEHTRKISELTELTNDMDNLLSSTDVGTIFLDRQLRIRKFTPQIAENFNLLAQDVGRPIETFTHRMHHPELMEDLRRVLASGEPVERELGDRDGRSHLLRVLPYRAKGTIQGVVLTLIDVTGMKAAEDALFHERYLLNSLLATVPDAIYFKDVRGRFIRANQVMARRLGLSDPAAAAGKSTLELVDQGAAAVWYEEDERVLKTGEIQTYKLEKREGAPGGSGWDLVTRLPLKDRNGSTVGVFGIFRDVTEQKLAEEKIQEAVRKRDEFLAMLSHELRNPLGAMVAATSLLGSEDVASHQRGRLVGVLERQSKQMARLLDDLLEASRVTQNKIELRKQVLDLRSVTHDAVEAVAGVMKERNLALTTEIDPEEIWVNGDPARLQQIQINLLSNAAKYTPRGGHVHLEVKRDGAEAVIRVRDDGIGIPKNMLETVFDLFVQSRHTLDRVEGGLGVGLTLVRSLVGMHGGTVKAYSEGEGRGAELDVRLPIALAGGRARELPKTQPRHADHVRVVVIEDNTDSRELLCELLLMAGFDCRSAGNGPDGLALAEEMEPSVVIADVGLPGMDGFELARRLRQNPKHRDVYLIALTGYGRAMDRETAMAAGFDRHLVKPFDTDELIRLLMDRTATEVGSPWRAHPAIERTAEAATTS